MKHRKQEFAQTVPHIKMGQILKSASYVWDIRVLFCMLIILRYEAVLAELFDGNSRRCSTNERSMATLNHPTL
jgi:hypothetical protein